MAQIFLSYRRSDTAQWAQRIKDQIDRVIGRDACFMDARSIEVGAEWRDVILQELEQVHTTVVLIGPDWLARFPETNRRRIDDPDDLVRREISVSLKRGIRVIPVLAPGGAFPGAADLPEEIRELTLRQGVILRDDQFLDDVDSLISRIDRRGAMLQFFFVLTIAILFASFAQTYLGEETRERVPVGDDGVVVVRTQAEVVTLVALSLTLLYTILFTGVANAVARVARFGVRPERFGTERAVLAAAASFPLWLVTQTLQRVQEDRRWFTDLGSGLAQAAAVTCAFTIIFNAPLARRGFQTGLGIVVCGALAMAAIGWVDSFAAREWRDRLEMQSVLTSSMQRAMASAATWSVLVAFLTAAVLPGYAGRVRLWPVALAAAAAGVMLALWRWGVPFYRGQPLMASLRQFVGLFVFASTLATVLIVLKRFWRIGPRPNVFR